MKRILWSLFLAFLSTPLVALRNGCTPGTTGCGNCFEYPGPPPEGCKTDSAGFSDFDGDFLNDLLYRNQGLLSHQAWLRYGAGNAAWKTSHPAGPLDSKWEAIATGFFGPSGPTSGDPYSDILWQHDRNGELRVWRMKSGFQRDTDTKLCVAGGCTTPAPPWKAVATGYFGGASQFNDGKSDILFWNSATGALKAWIMDGVTFIREAPLTATMPLSWNVVATGFFDIQDFDEWSDILWYNPSTGQVWLWMMNGTQVAESRLVDIEDSLNWKAVGVVDFDRNGYPDILFRNTNNGKLRYWEMDGPNRTDFDPVTPVITVPTDLSWKPVAR